MTILTINARPETFESKLPEGLSGPIELIENLLVANVKSIDIDNFSEYEENMDAEYRVVFNNGDEIHFDGYSGLWVLKNYDSLTKVKKIEALKDLRETLNYIVEDMKGSESDGQPDEAQEWHDFDPDC